MRSWRPPVAAALAAGLALATPAPVRAGPIPTDWSALRHVKVGTKVAVHLHGGAVHKGSLTALDEDGLTVHAQGGPLTLARADVREVRKARRSVGRKIAGFLLGAAAGAVGGAYLGAAAVDTSCTFCEDNAVFGAVLGFLGGAIVGAAVGLVVAARGEGGRLYVSPAAAAPNAAWAPS